MEIEPIAGDMQDETTRNGVLGENLDSLKFSARLIDRREEMTTRTKDKQRTVAQVCWTYFSLP